MNERDYVDLMRRTGFGGDASCYCSLAHSSFRPVHLSQKRGNMPSSGSSLRLGTWRKSIVHTINGWICIKNVKLCIIFYIIWTA
jgi:hypothetical protein